MQIEKSNIMETEKSKKLEDIKKLTFQYFNTLKPANDKTELYIVQIKLFSYFELGCIITDMLKLCVLALDQDAHKISESNKNSAINVSLILETVLQLFPMDEFELLTEINHVLVSDSPSSNE